MLLNTTTRGPLTEPNNDITINDFTSGCEVVIERRNTLGATDPSHTFTLSGEYKLVLPEHRPNTSDRVNAQILAGWEDVPFGGRTFLVWFAAEDNNIAHHSWLAVIVDNFQDRHHGRSNTWLLADASLYFLHDGDLTNVPHVAVFWDALGAVVRRFNEDAVSTSGANPNGYTQLLTPRVLPPEGDIYWKVAPQFGDVRMGFEFSEVYNGTYLYQEALFIGDVNDGTNWRVILRHRDITSTETTSSTTTPSTITPSREDTLAAEVERLNSTLSTVREAILRATIDHGGCEAGKREFLESTGLFSEDEIDECFTREYEVSWTATVVGTTTITSSSYDSARELFRETHLNTFGNIDELVVDEIRSNVTPDVQIDDVEEL